MFPSKYRIMEYVTFYMNPTVYALTLILTWIFPLTDVELTTSSKSPFITITLEPAILIRTCSTWRTISRILINTNYTQLAIKTAFRLASKLLDRSSDQTPRTFKTLNLSIRQYQIRKLNRSKNHRNCIQNYHQWQ